MGGGYWEGGSGVSLKMVLFSLPHGPVYLQGRMGAENSSVTEFILAGLTDQPGLQIPLFLLFLGFYVVTVVGNLGLITLIGLNSRLMQQTAQF